MYKCYRWPPRIRTLVANSQPPTHSISLVDQSHFIQSCSIHFTFVLLSLSSLPPRPLSSQHPIVAQNSRYTTCPLPSKPRSRRHIPQARGPQDGRPQVCTLPCHPHFTILACDCNLTGTPAESEFRTSHPCMLFPLISFVHLEAFQSTRVCPPFSTSSTALHELNL